MKNNSMKITLVISAAAVILSCSVSFPEIGYGKLVKVDEDGHLTEDRIYYQREQTHYIYADGSIESIEYEASGTQTGGMRGVYTYDPETMVFEIDADEQWDDVTSAWISGSSESQTTVFLTEYLFGNAYVETEEGSGIFRWNSYSKSFDGSDITEYEIYTVSGVSLSYEDSELSTDSSGTVSYGEQNRFTADITAFFPSGTEWEEGNVITLEYEQSERATRYYDDTIPGWEAWTDRTPRIYSRTFAHEGNFLFIYVMDY